MKKRIAVVVMGLSALPGCASIVSGVNQSISVETRVDGVSVAGAACTLSSNKGTWFVTTPGSLTVHRGFQDMAVECAKPGLETSLTNVPSHVRPIAFGNILFGGVIGVAVDAGDGAAFDYPELFTIQMSATAGSPGVSTTNVPAPAGATAAGAATDVSEHRYQLAAEQLAIDRSCATKPVKSAFSARGPGYETYDITCKSGEVLTVRCDGGQCRALQ